MKRYTSRILLPLLLLALSAASQPLAAEDRETVIFNVRGLWAEFCERYVEEALLGDLDGIETAEADHEADTVTVVFDPARLSPEELAAAIEDCPLMRVTDSETHELDRREIRRHRSCWCCFLDRDHRGDRT